MGVSVEQPWWFAAIALAIPLGVLAWRWFAAMSTARRWSAIVLRSLLIALLAGMLAGVSVVKRSERLAVIAVVDISESVQRFLDSEDLPDGRVRAPIERLHHWLREATRDRGPDDALGIVVFDGRTIAVATPSVGEVLDRTWSYAPVEGTDIAGALTYAAAMAPPGASARLVLLSDGVETRGDALRAAESIGGDQALRVDVVPLMYHVRDEVMIESVDAPPSAASESTIVVRVTLHATGPSRGTLRLLREGEELDINGDAPGTGRRVELSEGLTTELIELALPGGRIHRFEAIYEPDPLPDGTGFSGDTLLVNNRGDAFTLTPGRGRVLIIDGVGGGVSDGRGATLARVLERSGIDVSLVSADGAPTNLLTLQSYDLVILQNVPADALTTQQHDLLVAHVRDLGGGLVMVGGFDSFGAGGWKGSAIEPILPVRLDLPERAVAPEAAVMFVLDNSGSMSFTAFGSVRSKQQIANESTALAIQSLDRNDLVGVIIFNSDMQTLVPLGLNPDRPAVVQRVLNIPAGGGTNMAPALREAGRQLRNVEAKSKHIIVLSDGRSQRADSLPGIAASLRAEGVRISTIAIGEDADPETMDRIATSGGGTFHYVLNPNTLPRVFLSTVRVIRQPLVREQPFTPMLAGPPSALLEGLSNPPPLLGLVLTQARSEPTIQTLLVTPQNEPVLAHWNVELGQVAAFTSDTHGEWSAPWLAWPGYQRLWTNLARAMTRPTATQGFDLLTTIRDDRLEIRVEATDARGRPVDLLDLPTTVHLPSGQTIDLTLSQTGPGVYEGHVPADEQGNYIAIVKPQAGADRLAPVIGGSSAPRSAELRVLRSDPALLEQIAQITGGRVLSLDAPAASRLFDRTGLTPRRAVEPLWRSLMIWTLIVLMLDIGTRRIAWDRLVSRQFGVDLKREALEAVRDRSREVLAALGRLGRGKSERTQSQTALGPEDAARANEEELARRTQGRLAAVRAARQRTAVPTLESPTEQPAADPSALTMQQAPASPAPTPPPPAPEQSPPDTTAPGEGGLLAAKRRARDRFGGSQSS
ncbi:MAG: VWA domain-containing protein [Phycisphaeraceae bacterium]|nr:VWA domain-containing protein [Phycisphaeraceae bacterium]